MDYNKRDINIMIGKRLREARMNLGRTQAEFAVTLGVSDEHYRKYESGASGLSTVKLLILNCEYHIDSDYLITGSNRKEDFDVESYLANCSRLQKERFVERMLAFVRRKLMES